MLVLKCPHCRKDMEFFNWGHDKCPHCHGKIKITQDLSEDCPAYYVESAEPPIPLFEMNEGDLFD